MVRGPFTSGKAGSRRTGAPSPFGSMPARALVACARTRRAEGLHGCNADTRTSRAGALLMAELRPIRSSAAWGRTREEQGNGAERVSVADVGRSLTIQRREHLATASEPSAAQQLLAQPRRTRQRRLTRAARACRAAILTRPSIRLAQRLPFAPAASPRSCAGTGSRCRPGRNEA